MILITSRFSAHFKIVLASTVLAIMLLPASVVADSPTAEANATQPLLEKFENGFINWQSGEYIANVSAPVPAEYRGKVVNREMGKELALRVSRALADSVFLQIVAETRVDDQHRLSQLVNGDSEIKLAGNIRGKELIDTKWVNRDNRLWLEASYRISMHGVDGVISHIYDQLIETQPAVSTTSNTNKQAQNSQTVVYIDARGTGLQPALFPRIMDQQNVRLFNPADAGKSHVSENGVVEYVVSESNEPLSIKVDVINSIKVSSTFTTTLDWLISPTAAEQHAPVRKRKKRKTMKATEAEGLLRTNIIVSKEDAEKLRRSQENGELGANPRIIVITDGRVGGTEGMLTIPRLLWASLSPD